MNIAFQKTRAREQAKLRRAASLTPDAGPELIRHWPYLMARGQSVAGYWPIKDEIDVRPLMQALQDAGQTVCLPRIVRKAHPLEFRAYKRGDALKGGPYGTAEPVISAPEVTPDIVLLPLLAFTADGRRLGYGGGFYDRTLAKLRAQAEQGARPFFACAIAYSGQETGDVPTDEYDQRLDGVLTPDGFKVF